MIRVLLTLLLLAPLPAMAKKPVLIRGGEIHPVSGPALEGADVLIAADGTIAAVGPDLSAPAGARVVDASGKVVTPGLIDGMTRLGLVAIIAVKGSKDDDPGGDDPVRAAFRAKDAFHPANVAIPVTRAYGGVTSVVTVPTGGLVSGQSAWVDLAAPDAYGRVVKSPMAMHVMMGEVASKVMGGSRGATMLALRELYDDVRFYLEHKALFDENRTRRLAASRLDLVALLRTLDRGLPVVFTVHRADDIRAALDFAEEEGLQPIIAGGAEAWRVADDLARVKAPVIVQPALNLPSWMEMLGARSDNAAILHEAGVPVVLSTLNAYDYKHGVNDLRQLAGNAVRAGMPHDAALRAVTLTPAEVMGTAAKYGSLEPGKAGNVAVWTGDPFEMSSGVDRLFIHGEDVSLDNRQRQLFLRYRTLHRRAAPAPPPASVPDR